MPKSKLRTINASTIGTMVRDSFSDGQDAVVYGVTSRGMFIKTGLQRVIYLTSDRFKGPLTVNLNVRPSFQKDIKAGFAVYLKRENILIPAACLDFNLVNARAWEPALPTAPILSRYDQARRLKLLAEQVYRPDENTGLGWLLPYLTGTPCILGPQDAGKSRQLDAALDLRHAYKSGDASSLANGLSQWIGRGAGLTPSGDDFVLGVMLCLSRWGDTRLKDGQLANLREQVTACAHRSTTTLSACLIACAAVGLADERLVNALDWIKTDLPPDAQLAQGLLGWGGSSGVDVFTGFAALLS